MEDELYREINRAVCVTLGHSDDVVACLRSSLAASALSLSTRCLDDLRRCNRVAFHCAAGRIWYPIAGLIHAIDRCITTTSPVPLTQRAHRHTTLSVKANEALKKNYPLFVIADRPIKIAFDKRGAGEALSCSLRTVERMLEDGRLRSSTLCSGKVLIPHWSLAKALDLTTV